MRVTLALLLTAEIACAATTVDIYVDFESGTATDLWTDATMAAMIDGDLGASSGHTPDSTPTAFFVGSGNNAFGGSFTIDSTSVDGSGTRSLLFDHDGANESYVLYLTAAGDAPAKVSMGAMWKTSIPADGDDWANDVFALHGNNGFAVAQHSVRWNGEKGIRAHGGNPTSYGDRIAADVDTWYWITMLTDPANSICRVRLYNPSTWEQVGSESTATISTSTSTVYMRMNLAYVAWADEETSIDNVVIDWTNATYPLLPDEAEPEEPDPPTRALSIGGKVTIGGKVSF